jgi:hypothetical protein
MPDLPLPGGARPALPPGRRRLFRLIVLAGLYGLAEAGSLLAFRLSDGRAFHFRRLQRERLACRAFGEVPGRAQEETIWAPHPYLGVVFNPRYRDPMPGYHPITAYGFTGARSPIHKRGPGKVIVGITGGSVACMFGCQGGAALVRELGRAPGFKGKQVVLVNLAVGAFKQPQQVMALNYLLALGGELDLLLNLDGFNEVALYPSENWCSRVFPLYPRSWHFLVAGLPYPAAARLVGATTYLQSQRARWARWFSAPPLRYSVTANLVWRARDRVLASEVSRCEVALRGGWPTSLPAYAIGPPSPHLGDEDALLAELVRIWQRCSLQLARTCAAHGIRYCHFLQPNQYLPGSKPLAPRERRVAWNETILGKHWVEKGYPLLRRAGKELAEQGVCFRDLTMIFAGDEKPYYIDACCHLNRSGNEVLAGAIARAILETPEPPR